MPTPRKTTEQHRISGQLSARPQRFADQGRGTEPTPDPVVGNAPRHLNDAQKTIWREVMSEIPPCVATKADRLCIEIAVRMIERMRHVHVETDCKPGCPGVMTSSDYSTLNRCLSQLGMTPSDRSKIKVAAPPKEIDEWEDDFGPMQ
jgi:phage terminase small subunit